MAQSAQEKEAATADSIAAVQAAADTAAVGQIDADTTTAVQAAADTAAVGQIAADTAARDLDIHMAYSFDTFSQPYNRFWQIFRMGAAFKTDLGPVLGTVNFGNLHAGTDPAIAETGIQLQAEFWPQITENTYAWLAYAYSPFAYFPSHRASAEYWYGFDKGWVLSAGASYFYFDRNILIPALSLEKYLGSYWLSAKSHFHLKEAGTTASLFLTARRYSNDTDYIELKAGAGTAPDEPWDLAADLDRQEAYSLKLGMKKKLTGNFAVSCSAGYSREQYNNDLWRNRFETFINIIYSPSAK
ncbi:MAG: YaiO family outer membrane beta-barrel protein [Bacteroidales bacterium]|nr:YaiO family outer membrane beta-barrel protein [Bacteroidales bacterium]